MSQNPLGIQDSELCLLIQKSAELIHSYVRPIVVAGSFGTRARPQLVNGTITFLNTGRCYLGVTNQHVLAELQRQTESMQNSICQVGEMAINLEDRLIDAYRGSGIDLATFRFSKEEVEALSACVNEPSSWPPKPPEKDEFLFLVGYPSSIVNVDSPTELTFPYFGIGLPVVEVSETCIMLSFDDRYLAFDDGSGDAKSLYNDYNFYGMSGSGAFAMQLSAKIAGIVHGGNEAARTLKCTRADCILEDGNIRRP